MIRWFGTVYNSLTLRLLLIALGVQFLTVIIFLTNNYDQWKTNVVNQPLVKQTGIQLIIQDLLKTNDSLPTDTIKLLGDLFPYLSENTDEDIRQLGDLKTNNPKFWYFIRVSETELTYGEPRFDPNSLDLLSSTLPSYAKECRSISLNSENLEDEGVEYYDPFVFRIECKSEIVFEIVYGGVVINYRLQTGTPLLTWLSTELNEGIFISSLFLLVMPIFFYIATKSLRQSVEALKHISTQNIGHRIQTKGVFSEIAVFIHSINHALARLDSGFARERRLRDAIAHEIRRPLTILRSKLHQIENDEQRIALDKDVERMDILLSRLLELARLGSDAANVNEIDLTKAVRRCCERFLPLALERGSSIDFRPPNIDEVRVWSSQSAISMIVSNLVENAILHGNTRKPLVVSVDEMGTVIIRDFGSGFPLARRESILSLLNNRQFPKVPGEQRLGLIIVAEVAHYYDLRIKVQSDASFGTEFKITFKTV